MDKETINRAMLGDPEEAQKCTTERVFIPCPLCGDKMERKENKRRGKGHEASVGCVNQLCPMKITQATLYGTAEVAYRHAENVWNTRANLRSLSKVDGNTSDGYHTFNELYHHRAVLTSVICNAIPQVCWKSKLHHDGTMYDGMFIVGIDTPGGQASYHYDINPYWGWFRVPEMERSPEFDGHTSDDAIRRISNLDLRPAPIAKECAQADEPNEALTLEELKAVSGTDVVWLMDSVGTTPVFIDQPIECAVNLAAMWNFEDYGPRRNIDDYNWWLAFRRPPQKGDQNEF